MKKNYLLNLFVAAILLLAAACSQPTASMNDAPDSADKVAVQDGVSKSTITPEVWNPTKVYYNGDYVIWVNRLWMAKWYTQGEEPGTTGIWGVWSDKGPYTQDTQKPSIPANLMATEVTSSTVTLDWADSTDDVQVAGYFIKQNGVQLTTPSVPSTFQVTGLTPETTYTFAVCAYDTSDNVSDYCATISVTTAADVPVVNVPFPNNMSQGYSYYNGCTSPYTYSKMNNDILALYQSWAVKFLKPYTINAATGQKEGYIIEADGTGSEPWTYCTQSEAHGYGMITLALMSGSGVLENLTQFGQSERYYFDRMVEVVITFKSREGSTMMQWALPTDGNPSNTTSSATDGDMDIIYALLLADKQWGSNGTHNYRSIAEGMLNNMFYNSNNANLIDLIGGEYWVRIGDWARDWNTHVYNNITRPSDWLINNFRTFATVSQSALWNQTITDTYSKYFFVADNYSPQHSLMPDFITGYPENPAHAYGPAYDGWWMQHDHGTAANLEGTADGKYYYNACRYPWRLGADIVLYDGAQETEAKNRLVKLANRFKNVTPDQVWDGFNLDGTEIPKAQMPDPLDDGVRGKKCFVAPIATAFLAVNGHQGNSFTPELQAYWDYMAIEQTGPLGAKYYSNSVNLLNMLLISGNWWNPESK